MIMKIGCASSQNGYKDVWKVDIFFLIQETIPSFQFLFKDLYEVNKTK